MDSKQLVIPLNMHYIYLLTFIGKVVSCDFGKNWRRFKSPEIGSATLPSRWPVEYKISIQLSKLCLLKNKIQIILQKVKTQLLEECNKGKLLVNFKKHYYCGYYYRLKRFVIQDGRLQWNNEVKILYIIYTYCLFSSSASIPW